MDLILRRKQWGKLFKGQQSNLYSLGLRVLGRFDGSSLSSDDELTLTQCPGRHIFLHKYQTILKYTQQQIINTHIILR